MSLLAKLLLGDPGVENSQVEDLQIGREVELCTTAKKRPRKEKDVSPSASKKVKTSKPTKTVSGEKKNCSKSEQEKLLEDVSAKVCSELRKVSLKGHYYGSI